MRVILLFLAIILSVTSMSRSEAQLIEMAANCDKALTKLGEIMKSPDAKTAQKIKELLGVDSLIECDTTDGRISCFQCLNDNQELKLIQILHRSSDGLFENLGFGCRCKVSK